MQPIFRARLVIAAFGVAFLLMALSFWQANEVEGYMPWFWPAWFGFAGLACVGFALRIHSAAWWWLSRTLVVIGALSRVGGLVGRYEAGKLLNNWQLPGGIAVYLLAAGALHRVWALDFRYWSRRAAASG